MNVPVAERKRRLVPLRDDIVGEILGGMPMSTRYDAASARPPRLPGIVRIGRRVLVDLDVLEAWLDAGGDRGTR